jgi:hypothetical protein
VINATSRPIAAASRIRERTSATAPPTSFSGTLKTTTIDSVFCVLSPRPTAASEPGRKPWRTLSKGEE